MEVDKEMICRMFELKYIKDLGYDPKDFDDFYREIYPNDWLDNDDYDTKIQMLSEAIENKTLIQDTEKYGETIKGKIL